MLSKFSGSRQDLKFDCFLVILLAVFRYFSLSSNFYGICCDSSRRYLSDYFEQVGISSWDRRGFQVPLAIVWNIEIPPRVLLGLIVGAGLSMCGSVMQSTVNNPIAEPYVLGISAGATLGATLSIILGLKVMISLGAFSWSYFGNNCCPHHCLYAGKGWRLLVWFYQERWSMLFFWLFPILLSQLELTRTVWWPLSFWTMGSLAGTTWSDLVLPTVSSRNVLSIFFLYAVSCF